MRRRKQHPLSRRVGARWRLIGHGTYQGVINCTGVLVDTCGWIAFVKSGLNLDSAMSNVIGKPDLIVIHSVWKELDDLSRGKRGLLLGLLKSRSEMMDDPPGEKAHRYDASTAFKNE